MTENNCRVTAQKWKEAYIERYKKEPDYSFLNTVRYLNRIVNENEDYNLILNKITVPKGNSIKSRLMRVFFEEIIGLENPNKNTIVDKVKEVFSKKYDSYFLTHYVAAIQMVEGAPYQELGRELNNDNAFVQPVKQYLKIPKNFQEKYMGYDIVFLKKFVRVKADDNELYERFIKKYEEYTVPDNEPIII